jgi:DNA adenine methylase
MLRIIEMRDRTTTFFYVDPPYFNSNMGHYSGYTENDFENLLKALASVKGKFLLSSYPSPILDKYIAENNWQMKAVPMPVMASKNRKEKIEVLTANFDITLGE